MSPSHSRPAPDRAQEATGPADARRPPHAPGLVMLCDVDFSYPDATRTHTVEVARGFAAAGFTVDLVARGPDPQLPEVRYREARGREHQRLHRVVTINAQTVALLWSRRRSARRFYVRDSWSCFPAVVVARLLGYRVVSQVDGIPYGPDDGPGPLSTIKRLLAIAMGRLSHGLLAVTPQIRDLLVELARVPPAKVAVIPNGVDIEFFTPQDRQAAIARAGLDPELSYLVFVGGFHEWTDFDALVEALALLAPEHPRARLLLVGDGPERDRIERRARELSVRDRIEITGMIADRGRVRDLLGAATVALLAYRTDVVSRTSASPVKLTEYMASGRAVVAVEIPGVRQMLEETGAGVVVRDSAAAIAAAVAPLLDPARADALGARGRRHAEERLSWETVIERTLPLFGL